MATITQRRDLKRDSVIITIEIPDGDRENWDEEKTKLWDKFCEMIKYFGNVPQLPSRLP